MMTVLLHRRLSFILALMYLVACGSESTSSGDDEDEQTDNAGDGDDDEDEDDQADEDDVSEENTPDAAAVDASKAVDASGRGAAEAAASNPTDAQAPPMPRDGGTPQPPPPPAGPTGPEDGDSSKPVVMIDGIPCRDPAGRAAFGRSNFMFDGRPMIVDYPCNKRERAPMTFILNLHGTTPVEQHFYQWNYFSAWKHVASHNLIIVTPSSVVTQWGNGDNGADDPHLMKIIEWVYQTFGTKFDLRQMWVGGHSWGSFFTSRFGCKEELKDKVKGLILMSGASAPACAARVSVLNTAAALPQPERLLDQSRTAMSHGCGAMMMRAVDMNNDETFWPECQKPWVHANYLMKTKMHATSMDPSVVKSLVDYVKQARP